MTSIYDYSINGSDHRPYALNQHKGKPVLLINLPLSAKQALAPAFEAARTAHHKYRSKIQVLGIPMSTGGSVSEERSIFAEYPVLEAVHVKNTFGGTMEPPLYHFLHQSMVSLHNANNNNNDGNNSNAAAGGSSMRGGHRDRANMSVDRLFLCFLIDKNGRVAKILRPETSETEMDAEISQLLHPNAGAVAPGGGAAGGKGSTAPAAAASAADLSNEELLRFVVDGINTLFQQNYSLVAFDEIQGRKLLQLLSDIFARLQPSMQMDLNAVHVSEAAPRMIDFLTKTLGYKVPALFLDKDKNSLPFEESFKNAEKTVIYPILYWMLSRMEQNEKRVYLARFLQPLDIPKDIIAQDEDVRNLHAQYLSLREHFIQTHRETESMRKMFSDPQETRRQVSNLEWEREHLLNYIKSARAKVASVPEKDALLAACRSLRLAQEEENKLAEKKVELQQNKISADFERAELSNQLQNLRRDTSDGRVDAITRRLKDEVQTNRIKLEDQIPLEIQRQARENNELRRLLSEPLDMSLFHSEQQTLDRELERLRAKVRERQSPGEDGTSLSTIHQQASRVQSRKAELIKDLSSLQADNNQALAEVASLETTIAQLRAATQGLNGEEFKEFSQQVRAKRAATESLRTRLAETRAEWGTLVFTENILKEQFQELDRQIGDLETKLGMQGYSQTMETLHRLTHEKDALEEMKGKTLEELSKVSQDMAMILRDRRTKITPLINELRTVRDTAMEVEKEWEERKTHYENQKSLLLEDVRKLTDTVEKLKAEASSNEALYHRLNVQRTLLQAQSQRVEKEKTYRKDPSASVDPQYKTYIDFFADTSKVLEQRSKDLQVRRRNVEEHHDNNVQQVEWFRKLKKILEAKMRSLKTDVDGNAAGEGGTLDEEIDRVMGGGKGVDMLVLNNN